MKKHVSVVVTCYNHAPYIAKCLESIFAQTYSRISLFVYNDGSTDNSEEVILKTLEASPFETTRYIFHKNKGVVATRNRALDEQQDGDFIIFVDSDNFLEENYIEAMLDVACKEHADIVYPEVRNAETKELILAATPFDLAHLYTENFIESCSLINRKKIGEVRYDSYLSYKKLEDYEFFCHLIIKKGLVAKPCFNTYLNYRLLDNSVNARTDLRFYYEIYAYILGKYCADYPELTKEALNINFLRLYDLATLDVISVYWDRGQGFSENDKETYPLNQKELILTVDADVKQLRIDLSEHPSHYSLVRLMSGKELLRPVWSNGLIKNDGYIFANSDPQLIYDVTPLKNRKLKLSYQVDAMPVSEYLATVIQENETKLTALEAAYHDVIQSRRWRYTTKLINLFRRKS